MALVVEDGTGKTDADSYLSLVDADAYNLAHSASTDWNGAVEAVKEKALRLATQYLDGNRFAQMRPRPLRGLARTLLTMTAITGTRTRCHNALRMRRQSLPCVS